MLDLQNLPDRIDLNRGSKSWRFSGGKIVRGREDDGSLETRDAIFGRLVRVGIHQSILDDGSEYAKLEADIETNKGVESVAATLKDARTGKCTYTTVLQLGRILAKTRKGQLLQLTAVLSKEKNRMGAHSTFVNGVHVDPVTLRPDPIKIARSGDFPGVPLDDQVHDLLVEIRSHEAYAQRPGRDQDPTTLPSGKANPNEHFDCFVGELASEGRWVPISDQESCDCYTRLACLAAKVAYVDGMAPTDVPETGWESLRIKHSEDKAPKKDSSWCALQDRWLESVKPKAKTAKTSKSASPAADEDYDPFA